MPYILSPEIDEEMNGMWFEGSPFVKKNIYTIEKDKSPPVNYDKHEFAAHSLTHIEAPKHINSKGKSVDEYFLGDYFFGKCTVLRLKGDKYKDIGEGLFHWEVTLEELKQALDGKKNPKKIILTTDIYRENRDGFHDPNYILTLSAEAAKWLVSIEGFNMYGTSWKSSDYCPGVNKRPIHEILFSKAIIMECLAMKNVPEGEYFLVAYPIRVKGASESVVTPVLFSYDEL